jgi:uncharacterized repeat protein (TIGR01451 family)
LAFDPNLFTIVASPDPIGIVLGETGTATITASNTNPSDWGYNLSFEMTIPDGVSYVSADATPTTQVTNPNSTITLTWENIKDLAPNETGYTFDVVLMSDETFRATGTDVPFSSTLSPVAVSGTVDTKPRGDAESGNLTYTKSDSTSVQPLPYTLVKTVPDTATKGASTPPPDDMPYTHEFVIENNTRQAMVVNISDILDNGLKYIGPISATGADAAQFLSPTIVTPTPGGVDNVTITWPTITLSAGSINTISYEVAIWNNYTVGGVEDSGARITHQTPLDDTVTLTSPSGPTVTSTGTTLAMDLTIDKGQSPSIIDIGTVITYTLSYAVNQYDDVNSVVITDVISDGQTYQSASIAPDSTPVKNPTTGETNVVWTLGNLTTSTTGTITFTTVVDSNYTESPGDPIVAGDSLENNVDIDGINANFLTATPDSASSSGSIPIGTIAKQFIQIYYRDNTTVKPVGITAIAPNDWVEFQVDYTYINVAQQKDIYIDDFLPLYLDEASITSIVYNPFTPITGPLATGTNGVEWLLDSFVPGNTSWTVNFRVQMDEVDFIGTDLNLAKLKGINSNDIVYSDRDQINVTFGEPAMTLKKAVAGPSPNAILSGQTYTYTVVIGNPQNGSGTVVDAFNVDFSDVIPNLLSYMSGSLFAVVSAGSPTFNAPTFTSPDQIAMEILNLKPDDEITLTYDVTVDAGIGPNLTLTNDANTTSPYSQEFDPMSTNYQYPDQAREASQTLTSASMPIEKIADISDGLVGDTVNYTLTWTVPTGLTAYNVVISDILPVGQVYDNNASPVNPASVVGETITWPTIPIVDATLGAVTLTYSFRALIDSSDASAPSYTTTQTNTGKVNWDSSPTGDSMEEEDTVDVIVRIPHVTPSKRERNVSRGETSFVTSTSAIVGEIIEYRITVTSDGATDAYAIEVIDQTSGLSPGTAYVHNSLVTPTGTTAYYDSSNNYIVWNIFSLGVSDSLELFFSVRITSGLTPSTILTNTATVATYSNINQSYFYPLEESNTVNILIEEGVRGETLEVLKDVQIKGLEEKNFFRRLIEGISRFMKKEI